VSLSKIDRIKNIYSTTMDMIFLKLDSRVSLSSLKSSLKSGYRGGRSMYKYHSWLIITPNPSYETSLETANNLEKYQIEMVEVSFRFPRWCEGFSAAL